MPVGLIGGAIISGAYFGDKMSPLSDTTNLAPAMAGTDLFTHIRYMMYTTIPSFSIALILFLIIGFSSNISGTENIDELLQTLNTSFNITPWLFVVPVLVIILIVKKTPAIPALLAGSVLGGIFGALAGAGVVWFTSWSRDYVMVLSVPSLVGWSLVSVAVAVASGLYPSMKAARLEPLETLRLG